MEDQYETLEQSEIDVLPHFLYIGIHDDMGLESIKRIDLPTRGEIAGNLYGILEDTKENPKLREISSFWFSLTLRMRYQTSRGAVIYSVRMPEIVYEQILKMDHIPAKQMIIGLSTYKTLAK